MRNKVSFCGAIQIYIASTQKNDVALAQQARFNRVAGGQIKPQRVDRNTLKNFRHGECEKSPNWGLCCF
jgi:hypothetical protein